MIADISRSVVAEMLVGPFWASSSPPPRVKPPTCVKDAGDGLSVNDRGGRPGARDRQALRDRAFAARQRIRARGHDHHLAGVGVRDRLTQRSSAAVVLIGDRDGACSGAGGRRRHDRHQSCVDGKQRRDDPGWLDQLTLAISATPLAARTVLVSVRAGIRPAQRC